MNMKSRPWIVGGVIVLLVVVGLTIVLVTIQLLDAGGALAQPKLSPTLTYLPLSYASAEVTLGTGDITARVGDRVALHAAITNNGRLRIAKYNPGWEIYLEDGTP